MPVLSSLLLLKWSKYNYNSSRCLRGFHIRCGHFLFGNGNKVHAKTPRRKGNSPLRPLDLREDFFATRAIRAKAKGFLFLQPRNTPIFVFQQVVVRSRIAEEILKDRCSALFGEIEIV